MMLLREDGILEIRFKEGIEITKRDAAELLAQKIEWTEARIPLLIIRNRGISVAQDLLMYGLDGLENAFTAFAEVVGSEIAHKATEIEQDFIFPMTTTKIFYSEEEAVKWLEGLL